MFKKLIRNKRAQQTAEYALLISLVVAAVIAMQTYAQRSLQAKIRDASRFMTRQSSVMGDTNQYEPYYLESSYDVSRDETTSEYLDGSDSGTEQTSNRARGSGGYQATKFCMSDTANW